MLLSHFILGFFLSIVAENITQYERFDRSLLLASIKADKPKATLFDSQFLDSKKQIPTQFTAYTWDLDYKALYQNRFKQISYETISTFFMAGGFSGQDYSCSLGGADNVYCNLNGGIKKIEGSLASMLEMKPNQILSGHTVIYDEIDKIGLVFGGMVMGHSQVNQANKLVSGPGSGKFGSEQFKFIESNKFVYVFHFDVNNGSPLLKFEKFEVPFDTWNITGLTGHTATLVEDKVVILGGMDPMTLKGLAYPVIVVNNWKFKPSFEKKDGEFGLKHSVSYHSAFVISPRIYLLGGFQGIGLDLSNPEEINENVTAYDIKTNNFTDIIFNGLHKACASATQTKDNMFILMGGYTKVDETLSASLEVQILTVNDNKMYFDAQLSLGYLSDYKIYNVEVIQKENLNRNPQRQEGSNLPTIIGGSIGGVGVLVLIVLAIFCFKKTKKRKALKESNKLAEERSKRQSASRNLTPPAGPTKRNPSPAKVKSNQSELKLKRRNSNASILTATDDDTSDQEGGASQGRLNKSQSTRQERAQSTVLDISDTYSTQESFKPPTKAKFLS